MLCYFRSSFRVLPFAVGVIRYLGRSRTTTSWKFIRRTEESCCLRSNEHDEVGIVFVPGNGTFALHGSGTESETGNTTKTNGYYILYRSVHTAPGPGTGSDLLSPIVSVPFPCIVNVPQVYISIQILNLVQYLKCPNNFNGRCLVIGVVASSLNNCCES